MGLVFMQALLGEVKMCLTIRIPISEGVISYITIMVAVIMQKVGIRQVHVPLRVKEALLPLFPLVHS